MYPEFLSAVCQLCRLYNVFYSTRVIKSATGPIQIYVYSSYTGYSLIVFCSVESILKTSLLYCSTPLQPYIIYHKLTAILRELSYNFLFTVILVFLQSISTSKKLEDINVNIAWYCCEGAVIVGGLNLRSIGLRANTRLLQN